MNDGNGGAGAPSGGLDPAPGMAGRPLRVFISYGHDEHAALAQRITNDLQARGHEVWFDAACLKPGADWDANIEQGLKWVSAEPGRGRFVLLITPHSVSRPGGYCLNEVALALDLRLRVVPVVVVWCTPPLSIYRIQRLDMRDCVPVVEQQERYQSKFHVLAEALELDEEAAPLLDGLDSRLQECLKPLDYGSDINLHLPAFTGRKWVIDEIDAWLANPKAARLFGIIGWAGTGKSAIAAFLCARRPDVAAFHICRYGHTQKADPRRCVTSIAYQLCSQLPRYRERLGAMDLESLTKDSNAQALFDQLVVQPLGALSPPPDRDVTIVIDALDEASQGDRNELAAFLASEFERAPGWLRLVVTSRPVPAVMEPLAAMRPLLLDTTRPENREDIREYVRKQLTTLTGTPDVAENVVETILARSEGLFLYAHWVCQELQEGHLSIDRSEDFPLGLVGAYHQYFDRQFQDLQTYKKQVRPVLGVIAAGYDFVPADVLTAIFHWTDLDRKDFFDPLGPLFPCEDGRYRPFHLSILDWLSDEAPTGAGAYYVSVREGHRQLAEYCWGKCARHIQEDRPLRNQYASYPFRHGVRHLLESGRYPEAVELLDYLVRHDQELQPEQKCDLDQFAKLFTIALGSSPPDEAVAGQIDPLKLARLLKGLYMTEPLYGGIRLLVEHHREAWPAILEDYLATDDYVLRHTIAEALADDYLESGSGRGWTRSTVCSNTRISTIRNSAATPSSASIPPIPVVLSLNT
jgi:hypothetical protein